MGLFYTNLTVYRPDRQALLGSLRRMRRDAFVSPTIHGYTVVFDQAIDNQDAGQIQDVGISLTRELSCSALAAMLHDDDVLYLWLFQNGKMTDHYNSLPQYFDPEAQPGPPEGGNSELVCSAFERSDHRARIESLLRANLLNGELPEVRGEFERHRALAKQLGMPGFVAGVCYSSIAGNYVPKEFIPKEYEGISFERV
jgi:hypothetical protein